MQVRQIVVCPQAAWLRVPRTGPRGARRSLGGVGSRLTLKAAQAFKYTYDERYLPIKLVMSSIGVDLVLCFFHAAIGAFRSPRSQPAAADPPSSVADKDPIADNHEGSGQTIWSNWCGPSDSDPTETYFTPEQAKSLADALLACQREGGVEDVVNPPAKGSSTAVPPAHVFQILKNPGGDIIFSYPPSDLFSSAAPVDVKGGAKRYIPEEYAALAMDVCRRPKESNVAAKTNCTRRLKSRHPVYALAYFDARPSMLINPSRL